MTGYIERPRYLCALGGAIGTLANLPRVVPILHASAGCGGNLTGAMNLASGYLGTGYCSGQALPSSNVWEKEIVFGGEERLKEQIENTLKVMDGGLYFVITGCMVEMIGDDVKNVAQKFNNGSHPVLAAETGGFRGNSYKGYDIVLKTLFKDYVAKNPVKNPRLINLWGIVPSQDVFWEGNLKSLKKLLNKLGYEVNTFFGREKPESLKHSGAASLNIIVSPIYGVESAKVFEEVHDVPYITVPFPIGASGTKAFLQEVGKALNIDRAFVDKVIQEEETMYYHYLQRLADVYNDLDLQRYAVVVGDVNYAQGITRLLADDLGWLPEVVIITDLLNEEEKDLIRKNFAPYSSSFNLEVIFDPNGANVIKHIKNHWPPFNGQRYYEGFNPGFIIGSTMERDTAEKLGVPFLSVTYPVSNRVVLDRSYAGYEGGLRMIEDLLTVLVFAR